MRNFRLAVVLSVYNDKLMCGFDDTRDLIDYMTGEHVYIWDIPVAMKLCRQSLAQQYPWLKNYELDRNGKPDSFPKFVRTVAKEYGSETIAIQPLRKGAFTARSCSETLQ